MVAQRDRHQARTARMRACRLGKFQNAIGRKGANRQIVVAGPTEATQIGAAADDFDQETRTEFRVGREDASRRGIEGVRGLDGGLLHRQCQLGACRRITRQQTVASVFGLVKRWHIEPAFRGQAPKQIGAVPSLAQGPFHTRHEHLAFSGGDDVGERRERLGVHERHGAADHDQRMTLVSLRRISRDSGEPHQRQNVDVVPLEGHREREHVELAHGTLRLERDQRRLRRQQFS